MVAADDSDGYETMVLGAGAGTLCVVDVYNSWCGPCEALSRKIGTLFNELGEFDIKFVQAKADAIKALAEFAVPARSKPLFLFIKGGKEVDRVEGALMKDQLVAFAKSAADVGAGDACCPKG